jgi:hypothetical protein
MENQQFGDEHGLGLNDAGVESVEVICPALAAQQNAQDTTPFTT